MSGTLGEGREGGGRGRGKGGSEEGREGGKKKGCMMKRLRSTSKEL